MIELIVIGIYTLVYVFVFIYQERRIKTQKELISSMKTFVEIFDIKKIEEYVKLNEKKADLKSEISNLDWERFTKRVEGIDKEKLETTSEITRFAVKILHVFDKKQRRAILDHNFQTSKVIIEELYKAYFDKTIDE